MKTQWTITFDHLENHAVEVVGPHGAILNSEEIKNHRDAIQFRLYDDDGVLYYSGSMVLGDDCRDLAPLDDYGQPNAGATEMEVLENGERHNV